MNRKLWMNVAVLLMAVCATSLVAAAQERQSGCEDGWRNGDRAGSCTIREQSLVATGSLAVDGMKNGGVSVKGWDQGSVLVRSKIQAWANTKEEADAIVGHVVVADSPGHQVRRFARAADSARVAQVVGECCRENGRRRHRGCGDSHS